MRRTERHQQQKQKKKGKKGSNNNNNNNNINPLRVVCHLFAIHTLLNSLLLSSLNKFRFIFWESFFFTSDEKWITNWYSFSHFHVGILLSALCYSKTKTTTTTTTTTKDENNDSDDYNMYYDDDYNNTTTKLCGIVICIIITYLAEGIFSIGLLDRRLVYIQLVIFGSILFAIYYFTNQQQQTYHYYRIIQLRKLSSSSSLSSSFSRRKKYPLPTIALCMQFIASLFRLWDMIFGNNNNEEEEEEEGSSAGGGGNYYYLGDTSSPVYQNISNMALCDMMIVTVILGFSATTMFEPEQQKYVLWAHICGLMISLMMISSKQGEMMNLEQKRAGGIGTFISILTALAGAV